MRCFVAVAAVLAFGGCAFFGDDDDGTGSGSNPGSACGGFAGLMCSGGEYCDLDDPKCAIGDGGGTCRGRPTVCPDLYAPVMGSDGMVYGNACEAHAAGADDCGPASMP